MPLRKKKDEFQDVRITVRISRRLMETLEKACKDRGLVKVSDAIRVAIHDAYEKERKRP